MATSQKLNRSTSSRCRNEGNKGGRPLRVGLLTRDCWLARSCPGSLLYRLTGLLLLVVVVMRRLLVAAAWLLPDARVVVLSRLDDRRIHLHGGLQGARHAGA